MMQFLQYNLYYLIMMALSVCGFFVAKHIRNHKTKNTPLVCPINFDCHSVVHSDYSKFLGVPVELLGMIYYAAIAVSQIIIIFLPQLFTRDILGVYFIVSLLAVIFSLYLIFVQVFILRKGCSWCILSTIISISIFILIFYYGMLSSI